jgi:hypothetical protein
MWPYEKVQSFDDFDDDWRAGTVLQGATAQREPTFRTLRQCWTTESRKNVVPTVDPSAVHERQPETAPSVCDDANAAQVIAFPKRLRTSARRRRQRGAVIPRSAAATHGARP